MDETLYFLFGILAIIAFLVIVTNIEMNDLKDTVSRLLTPDGKINDSAWYTSDERMINPLLKQQLELNSKSGVTAQRQREIELNPPIFTSVGDVITSQTTGTLNNIEDPLQTVGRTDIYDNTEIEDNADIIESNNFVDGQSYYDMTDQIDTIAVHTSNIVGDTAPIVQ
jgi:hypothetical protein